MSAVVQSTTILEKARELCQAILDEPAMQDLRLHIDQFMIDDEAKAQYEKLVEQGQALQEKQHRSEAITEVELEAFDKDRAVLMKNPVASQFIQAQDDLHHLQHAIQKLIRKTLELGRMPTEEDLEGSCGHGCGCQH